MVDRKYTVKRFEEHRFFFKHEPSNPELLHIWVRHLVEPIDAMETFLRKTIWNSENKRFETTSKTHTLYWFWLDEPAKKL